MAGGYEVERLAERISSYAESYYEGNPEISDDAFDLLVEQLRRMDPDNPVLNRVGWGYVVRTDLSDFLPHRFEVSKFEDKVHEVSKLKVERGAGVITPKIDGGSVCCYYTDGKLDVALSRGDGENGFDMTSKMRCLVPTSLTDKSFTGMVRGEITMSGKTFDSKFSDRYESNRNLVIGLMRRKEVTVGEVKDLTFVAYTVRGTSDVELDAKARVFNWLRMNGFECVDVIPSPEVWDDDAFRELILDYRSLNRFPIDGIVVTSEEYREMGDGTFVPVCEMAYKTMADSVVSTVRTMEWNLTRTGRMAPVVNIEPVFLSGAKVSRATAYNAQWVVENGLGEGSEVRVQRSGEVIPNIVEVISEGDPRIPEVCPSCGGRLSWDGTDVKCLNPDCSDKSSSRLGTWISRIATPKGLGSKSRGMLFDAMGIDSIDTLYERVDDIVDFSRRNFTPAKTRLYTEMADMLRRDVPAGDFFSACAIPGCGEEGSRVLGRHVDLILMAPVTDANRERILDIRGVQRTSKEWLVNHIDDVRRWAGYLHSVIPQTDVEAGYSSRGSRRLIAVTGKLSKSRSEFLEEMARYGYREGSMANASYLITNDPDSDSGKMRDARRRGVEVISERDFRSLIGAPDPTS